MMKAHLARQSNIKPVTLVLRVPLIRL